MPTFHVHIAAQTFSSEEKRALADALNLALHEAMDTPLEDRFIIISEHNDDEFYIHPTFPDMKRSGKRMLVTVTIGISRTIEQKRKLVELVTRYAVEKTGVSQDDISLLIYTIPLENMSFGGGKLVSDTELSMPWVNKKVSD
ncbi:tautomerase family protein [Escherichia coli]|nr:tautomerase family protein [Escherichia coli]